MSEEIKVSEEVKEVARREIKDYLDDCLIPRGTANPQFHTEGHHIQLLLNQRDTKIAALEAEVKELMKDRVRLKWLISTSVNDDSTITQNNGGVCLMASTRLRISQLRSAIDTALNSTKGEK